MTHASLFSGIGAPEIAAAWMGWDNLFHCEINPFGRKVLEYWFPKSESYKDITKTNFTKWRGHVDVLTGGFPCQPFSYAGKRGGASDDRYLWPEMLRVIEEVRPAWLVGENVAGITTMVEPGEVSEVAGHPSLFGEGDTYEERRGMFTIERVCADLEGLGYSVQPVLIPACAVGAPHKRDRVFIIGRRDDAPDTSHLFVYGREPRNGGDDGRAEESELGGDNRTQNEGRSATDTEEQQSERAGLKQRGDGAAQQGQLGGSRCEDGGIAGLGRWDTFPTVSPIHRGNDGLPFDVARLSIPFRKWRTEALKACGNAIVPQVMYEIFRAIQAVENSENPPKNRYKNEPKSGQSL